MKKITGIISAFIFLPVISGQAEVRLPSLLSEGMVVQRNQPVRLWGTAAPGEKVTVTTSAYDTKSSTETGNNGKWEITISPLPAGGPYEIQINDISIPDVMCGEVVLCSGQSNMELPIKRVTDMFADEIAEYENRNIRQFFVPQITAFHGPDDNTGESSWNACIPENEMSFSALAYFMAKKLNEETGLPVGIINASWGGTPIESWISEETIVNWPEALAKKQLYEDDGYRERLKKLEGENFHRWNIELYKQDPGINCDKKWFEVSADDAGWESVDLLNDHWGLDRQREIKTPINGSHWLRKKINLTKDQAKGDAVLRLGCIEGADSAYVNGQFVGTIGYQYPPRIYPVSDGLLKEGENVIAVRVISQHGEPKCVPEKPYKLITGSGKEISLEGEWLHKTGGRLPEGPDMIFWHYTPVVLFDGMISPIFNYPVGNVVWYQGESNVSNRDQYPQLLEAMINDWRKGYKNNELSFYVVELADFLHPSDTGGRKAWAEMRANQAKVADGSNNVYLIKNSDLGEWNDIHPLDKKTLGNRVAEKIKQNIKD